MATEGDAITGRLLWYARNRRESKAYLTGMEGIKGIKPYRLDCLMVFGKQFFDSVLKINFSCIPCIPFIPVNYGLRLLLEGDLI